MNRVKCNPMIEYETTDSPATSREPDRGHGTYILHSEHARHTKLFQPKRRQQRQLHHVSKSDSKQEKKQEHGLVQQQ
jgi:hypothetical protein